jgi:hypothetical protein
VAPLAYTRRIHRKTTGRFLQIPFRFDPNRYQNDEKRNLKEFGVLKDTIKGTSSPKNVQTISFEGIRMKEFEGIWSFFLCMLRVLAVKRFASEAPGVCFCFLPFYPSLEPKLSLARNFSWVHYAGAQNRKGVEESY